jgi:hypothetical protein
MARLPIPGSDVNTWGDILNDFLNVEHNNDGTLKTTGSLAQKAPTSRLVNSGTGLSGGGDLTADRTLSVTNDSTTQKVEVAKNGTLQATRKRINFIQGSNVTLTVADDAGNNKVDVTVATAASTTPIVRSSQITTGNITFPDTLGAWQALRDSGNNTLEVSIPAQVGDWVELALTGMYSPTGTTKVDIAIMVGSSLVRFLSTFTATPAVEGDPSLYQQPQNFRTFGYSGKGFVVTSGDRDGANVRFVVATLASGTGTFYASNNYPFYMRALNMGVTA